MTVLPSRYTLALIPGMQCTQELFVEIAARLRGRLAAGVRVEIAPVVSASLQRTVANLLALDEYVIPVGHSLGGTVAMAATRAAPGRIPAMVTMCANPRAPRSAQRTGWQDQISRVSRGELAACIDELLPRLCGPDVENHIRQATYLMMEETGATRYLNQLQIQQQRIDERPGLATFTGPVLAFGAEHDQLVTAESALEIAEATPRGKSVIVANAGHMLPLEKPQDVAETLADWLREISDEPIATTTKVRLSMADEQ